MHRLLNYPEQHFRQTFYLPEMRFHSNEKLRFAPSSFMVLRENSEGSRVAQMNLPAITMDGELLICMHVSLHSKHSDFLEFRSVKVKWFFECSDKHHHQHP